MKYIRSNIPNIDPNKTLKEDQVARKSGRMLVEGISCSLGKIKDLSKTGARFVAPRPMKVGGRTVMIMTGKRVQVKVTVVCRHVKKLGWRRYEIGANFEGVDSNLAGAIMELMRTHCRFLEENEAA